MWRLENAVQKYAWGSRSVIPDLLGEPNTANEPWAELWIGAHPRSPSRIVEGDQRRSLEAAILEAPEELLGAEIAARFGARLPFLLKVLAASAPLSIQCHPNAEEARAGFERENALGIPLDAPNRSYRDASHKPELISALTPITALKGFRKTREIVELLQIFCPSTLEEELRSLSSQGDLARFFSAIMSASNERRRATAKEAAERSASNDSAVAGWVTELYRRYPGDIGVLSPLMLNLVTLSPGEALFLESGELHAYLEGAGVEIMASSDNVLRGGLTEKHIDVPELLRIVRFEAHTPKRLGLEPIGALERAYLTPAPEFSLSVIDLGPSDRYESPKTKSADVLLVTEGEVVISAGSTTALARGQTAFVPAGEPYALSGSARVFRATVPLPRESD
jgi:mannose-6-phosphate isomerase